MAAHSRLTVPGGAFAEAGRRQRRRLPEPGQGGNSAASRHAARGAWIAAPRPASGANPRPSPASTAARFHFPFAAPPARRAAGSAENGTAAEHGARSRRRVSSSSSRSRRRSRHRWRGAFTSNAAVIIIIIVARKGAGRAAPGGARRGRGGAAGGPGSRARHGERPPARQPAGASPPRPGPVGGSPPPAAGPGHRGSRGRRLVPGRKPGERAPTSLVGRPVPAPPGPGGWPAAPRRTASTCCSRASGRSRAARRTRPRSSSGAWPQLQLGSH